MNQRKLGTQKVIAAVASSMRGIFTKKSLGPIIAWSEKNVSFAGMNANFLRFDAKYSPHLIEPL